MNTRPPSSVPAQHTLPAQTFPGEHTSRLRIGMFWQAPPPAISSPFLPRYLAVILAWLGLHYAALAGAMMTPPPEVRDEPAGLALAAEIRTAMPMEDSEIHGVFIVTAGKNKSNIPVVCKVRRHEGIWETIYQAEATATAGAENLDIVHTTNGPSLYLYSRAPKPGAPLPEPAPASGAALDSPFAGTDFSLGDLGLDFLHWAGQCKLKGEMRLGQQCFVLESSRPQKDGIVRIKSWIDMDTLGPLVAAAYDSGSREIKEFSLDSSSIIKDAAGRWQLKQMSIENKKTHSHTDLKFDMPKEP